MSQSCPQRRGAFVCVLLSWFAHGVSGAAAQTGPTRGPALNWVRLAGGESCIAPVELARRVEKRLGRIVFVRAGDAIIVIEGRVGPDPAGGFNSVIRVSDPDGNVYGVRELSVADPDCRKLDEVVSLVMAITIRHQAGTSGIALPADVAAQLDALFADEPTTLDPSEVMARAPRAAATDSPAQMPAGPRRVARFAQPTAAWGLSSEGSFGLVTGLQPVTSFGPNLRLQAGKAGLGSVALSGRLGLLQLQRIADEGGVLSYQPMQLGLSVCPPARRLWLSEFNLCADVRLGWLHVGSRGFMHNLGAQERWWELAAVAGARTTLIGPSYLQLRVGVPIRLIRPEFRYRDQFYLQRTAFVAARVGFELELGLGIDF